MHVAVISDVHGNLEALEVVLRDAKEWGADEIWCLGDTVGYGPDPEACLQRVRREARLIIPGNHDYAVLGKISVDDFNPDARRAILWTREQLSEESRTFLAGLPERRVEGEFTLVHGSPRHPIWEYVLSLAVATVNFSHFDTKYCLIGHSHIPLFFQLPEDGRCWGGAIGAGTKLSLDEGRWMLNPGSVGQPRDSDPRASYARLDTEEPSWELVRLAYPVERTQAKMREAGLPERLIARIAFGW